jgi:hypothetical protein
VSDLMFRSIEIKFSSNDILFKSAFLCSQIYLIQSAKNACSFISPAEAEVTHARSHVFFHAPLNPVQNAMEKLEAAGVLVSRFVGRTREYEFSPRYPVRSERTVLLNRALDLYPSKLRDKLLFTRSRPQRKGPPGGEMGLSEADCDLHPPKFRK